MKNHLFPFCGNQVRHDGSKREVIHKEIKYSLFLWRSGKVCLVQFREFVLRKLVLGNYHLSHVGLLFLKSWSLSLTYTLFSLFLFSVCVSSSVGFSMVQAFSMTKSKNSWGGFKKVVHGSPVVPTSPLPAPLAPRSPPSKFYGKNSREKEYIFFCLRQKQRNSSLSASEAFPLLKRKRPSELWVCAHKTFEVVSLLREK